MSLAGSNNEQKIWNYLYAKLGNAYGVAGIMGNMTAESGLVPNNLQNSYEKKLGFTDATYTAAVDNGSYTSFIKDSAGYGLVQWTYWSLKQGLYNYAKSTGKSIGDLEMQLEFLCKQLSEDYPSVWNTCKTTKSVLEASNAMLLKFERPADQSEAVQNKRAGYGQAFFNKYAKMSSNLYKNIKQERITNMGYTNSSLVVYTKLSPNNSGQRTHSIDRITPHCVVGQCSIETLGGIFQPTSRKASSNYGIGADGRVGMYVEEKNRSWCSSSNANDQRAVTIECASDTTAPYAMNSKVYTTLINLCVDICKRNGKKKLLWLGNKETALNYSQKSDEMVLTAHRWFANTACPGDWLYSRLGDLAKQVTAKLGGSSTTTTSSSASVSSDTKPDTSASTASTAQQNTSFPTVPFTVQVLISNLNIRKGAGTNYATTGSYTGKGTFTISAVQNGWGKLKSNAGWIYLENSSWVKIGSHVGGETTSTSSATNTSSAYKVQVTASALNIRKGAGTGYAVTGCIRDKGVYTIVAESTGTGATKWLKLKSGAGWIASDYTKKV